MTEFFLGDSVRVALPKGYSKRGVLGISVLYNTSPESRFEGAQGTVTRVNPQGPYAVPQYLVDFRPFDNSRVGIPWQAQWFREEWMELVERASADSPPPTAPGPRIGAEDSPSPVAVGTAPGGDDRTPAQEEVERQRVDAGGGETPPAPPSVTGAPAPGVGEPPFGAAFDEPVAPAQPATPHAPTQPLAATGDPAAGSRAEIEAAPSAATGHGAAIGGDRVGGGAGLLTPPAVPHAEMVVESYTIGAAPRADAAPDDEPAGSRAGQAETPPDTAARRQPPARRDTRKQRR